MRTQKTPPMYEECREATDYLRRASEAEAKAQAERHPLPGASYWAGVAEAAKKGADVAWQAHKIGKCACGIRDQIDRQNNRQKSSLKSE